MPHLRHIIYKQDFCSDASRHDSRRMTLCQFFFCCGEQKAKSAHRSLLSTTSGVRASGRPGECGLCVRQWPFVGVDNASVVCYCLDDVVIPRDGDRNDDGETWGGGDAVFAFDTVRT